MKYFGFHHSSCVLGILIGVAAGSFLMEPVLQWVEEHERQAIVDRAQRAGWIVSENLAPLHPDEIRYIN
jgi:hypothetical protein